MKNVYDIVTERILEQLNEGIIPWQKPWTGGHNGAYNYITNRSYSILNQIILKHPDGYMTFNQAKALGGRVKKGAKAEYVTFWKVLPIEEKDDDGNVSTKKIPFLRYYQVFWVGDIEGIEIKERTKPIINPIEEAEAIVNKYMTSANHPTLINNKPSDRAYYSPMTDKVVVPMIEQFKHIEEYYSTLFHELTHSTGAKSRLNRLTQTAHFGNEEYSKEELVAEIGASALVNISGIETEKSFRNSASYIQGWASVLKDNVKMIVEASSKADKAVKYILGEDITDDDPDKGSKAEEVKPEVKEEVKKPESKPEVQKALKNIEGYAKKAVYKIFGTKDGYTYASDGVQILRTSEAVTVTSENPDGIKNIEGIINGLKPENEGTINYTLKEFKKAMTEAKNGKRNAKVIYTTPEGIAFNAKFLYNAMLATASNKYRYTNYKTPATFEGATASYLLCPINRNPKNTSEVKEGFTVIA